MEGLEKILTEKINSLKELIRTRDVDEDWLNERSEDGYDTKRYHWHHCGGRDNMQGKVDGLQFALDELKREPVLGEKAQEFVDSIGLGDKDG